MTMPGSHGLLSNLQRLQRILQCGAGKEQEKEGAGSAAVARSGITLGCRDHGGRGTVPATRCVSDTRPN
jgi:hypothetical protein